MTEKSQNILHQVHKDLVAQYNQSASAAVEELILLIDLGEANHERLYLGMNQSEHPVFGKSTWVGEVADRNTEKGYWQWVSGEIADKCNYRLSSNIVYPKATLTTMLPLLPYTMPAPSTNEEILEVLRRSAETQPSMPFRAPTTFGRPYPGAIVSSSRLGDLAIGGVRLGDSQEEPVFFPNQHETL